MIKVAPSRPKRPMKTALFISFLLLVCFGCNATNVSATDTLPEKAQPTVKGVYSSTHDPARTAAESPQYSGEIGTVAGDQALADFLWANDGKVVNLTISTSINSTNHGEDWFSLCGTALSSSNCESVNVNYLQATEYDIFWRSSAGTDTFSGFYIVRANQGVMHQGFLSISLLGMP